MRTLLNIIWLVFGGIWLWLGYILAGVIACALIVTIPAGVACFRIANYVLWPFGKRVIEKPGAGAGSCLMNAVWFIIAGIPLAIGHVFTAIPMALSIVGIPPGNCQYQDDSRDGLPLRKDCYQRSSRPNLRLICQVPVIMRLIHP